MYRNQIIGIRTTDEFLEQFDGLCKQLGHNRSEVIRFCLKRFLIEQTNQPNNVSKIKSEMF